MAVILYEVNVNGTDVMNYTKEGEVVRMFGDNIPIASLTLRRNVTDVLTPAVGDTITVKRGDSPANSTYFIFEGEVVDIKKSFGEYKLKCFDKIYTLVKRGVNKSYDIAIDSQAGVITDIIKDLIETYAELTASISQSSGNVNVLQRFVCKRADVYDKVLELLNIINYQMYYDASLGKIIVEPKGFTASTVVLKSNVTGQVNNLIRPTKWKSDNRRLVNHVIVEGAIKEVETTETFNGDGAVTDFPITFVPKSVKVFVDSVLKIGGVTGSTESFDYTVDTLPDNPQIKFEAAPAVGVNNVEIRYSYEIPVPVDLRDDASIILYGQVDKTIQFPDIKTVDDATETGLAYLDKYSTPFSTAICYLDNTVIDINVGELIRINDDINNEDRQLVITKIKHKIPYQPDELTLGDEAYRTADWGRDVERRLKRILEKLQGETDRLTQVVRTDLNVQFVPYQFKVLRSKRYDSFILGHPINGLIGMGIELDRMEAVGNWVDGGGTRTFTIVTDAATKQVGSNSLKLTWVGGTGDASIVDSTSSLGDLSAYTGINSGTPTQGTVGMWVNLANATDLTGNITLRIGSDLNNYTEMNGREYTSSGVYGLETATWVAGWNYVLFDLDGGTETGTPDWTAVDYSKLTFNLNAASGTIYVDYYTVSKSNFIALNGLGLRTTGEVEVFNVVY